MQKIHAHLALTPKGWVRDLCIEIEDSRIAQVSNELPKEHYSVDLLLPAPVNLHSHAFQRALAGLTETRGPNPQDSFWTWRKLMFKFLDRLTPRSGAGHSGISFHGNARGRIRRSGGVSLPAP